MLSHKPSLNQSIAAHELLWRFLTLIQPDSSVEPFFDSVVKQLGIPDVFSLQMCGAGLSGSSAADPPGGSLVSYLSL